MTRLENDNLRKVVRAKYSKIAEVGKPGCGCSDAKSTSIERGYSSSDVNQVPDGSNMGLGCGNPKAIASLNPGETVLDLGSGGGFDCFLAVNEVGKQGQ